MQALKSGFGLQEQNQNLKSKMKQEKSPNQVIRSGGARTVQQRTVSSARTEAAGCGNNM